MQPIPMFRGPSIFRILLDTAIQLGHMATESWQQAAKTQGRSRLTPGKQYNFDEAIRVLGFKPEQHLERQVVEKRVRDLLLRNKEGSFYVRHKVLEAYKEVEKHVK